MLPAPLPAVAAPAHRGRGGLRGRGRGGRGRGAAAPVVGGPVVAPPAAEVVLTPEEKLRDVKRQLLELGIPCPNDVKTKDVISSWGLKPFVNSGETNPHSVGAAARYAMTARALAHICTMGAGKPLPLQVVSMWGSARDSAIALRVDPTESVLQVRVFQQNLVPQDIGRAPLPEERRADDAYSRAAPFVLVVNIYQTAAGLQNTIREACVNRGQIVLWVGNYFSGPFGRVLKEAVWKRNRDDTIEYYADAFNPTYPIHPACDWLHVDGSEFQVATNTSFAWTVVHTLHDTTMRLIVCRNVPGRVLNAVRREVPSPFVTMRIPENAIPWYKLLWNGAKSLWSDVTYPERQLTIDKLLADNLRLWMGGRMRTPYVFKCLHTKAHMTVGADEDLRAVMHAFPDYARNVVEDTASYVFFEGAEHTAINLAVLRSVFGANVEHANEQIGKVATAGQELISNQLSVVKIGLLGLLFYFQGRSVLTTTFKFFSQQGVTFLKFLVGSFLTKTIQLWKTNPEGNSFRALKIFFQQSGLYKLVKELCDSYNQLWLLKNINSKMAVCYKNWCAQWHQKPYGMLPHLSHPVVAALIEEGIKWALYLSGKAGSAIATAESMAVIEGSIGQIRGMTFHSLWGLAAYAAPKVGRAPMIAISVWHLFNNWSAWQHETGGYAREQHRNAWAQFVHDYHYTPWGLRPSVMPDVARITSFFPEQAAITAQPEPYGNVKVQSKWIGLRGEFDVQRENLTFVHYIIPTNVPVYIPGNTRENYIFTVKNRVLAEAPYEEDGRKEEDLYNVERSMFFGMVRSKWVGSQSQRVEEVNYEDNLDPWLENIKDGSKKKRAIIALEKLHESPFTLDDPELNNIEINMKMDEGLCKMDEHGYMQLKPRTIANVGPRVQVLTGPVVLGMTQKIKQFWPFTLTYSSDWSYVIDNPEENPIPAGYVDLGGERLMIEIVFGSGATAQDLSAWMLMAHSRRGIFIIVAGDDSLVAINSTKLQLLIEGDASMFDQSQSFPLLHDLWGLYEALGGTDEVISIFRRQARATYQCRGLKVSRSKRSNRETGGADTTLGNTIVMGVAWAFVLTQTHCDPGKFAATFLQDFGFEMKIKTFSMERWTSVTFLKGMWYASEFRPRGDNLKTCDGFFPIWSYLPSRILKLGKSLKNPSLLYQLPYGEACGWFISDVLHSLYALPIIPGFSHLFANLMKEEIRLEVSWSYMVENRPKIQPRDWEKHDVASIYVIDRQLAVEAWSIRYNVPFEEVLQWIDMCGSVQCFRFFEHPLHVAFARVDYA